MYIKPTMKASGSVFDIHEDAFEMLLHPADSMTPCPWDADIEVKSGEVIITGQVSSGGPNGTSCVCKCHVEDFSKYYHLELPESFEKFSELLAALTEAGWEATNK